MTLLRRTHAHHLLLGALWLAVVASPAAAQPAPATAPPPVHFDPTIRVHADHDGVTTRIEVLQLLPGGQQEPDGVPADQAGGHTGYPVHGCRITRLYGSMYGGPRRPDTPTYVHMHCGADPAGFVTIAYLGADQEVRLPAITVDPEALARSVRDRLPIPQVNIRAAPATALVGLETWFWLAGSDGTAYQGTPLEETASAGGVTVQVQARPSSYRWDFGDGASVQVVHGTGRPYPARSPIRHTYQRAAPGVQVRSEFRFSVRWRQPGVTDWAALPPITRSVTATVPVAQSQGALTR